jgi:hypothetical protein
MASEDPVQNTFNKLLKVVTGPPTARLPAAFKNDLLYLHHKDPEALAVTS